MSPSDFDAAALARDIASNLDGEYNDAHDVYTDARALPPDSTSDSTVLVTANRTSGSPCRFFQVTVTDITEEVFND